MCFLCRKPRNRHRNRGFALLEMDLISIEEFKSMFRIDRLTFEELEEELDPILKKNEIMAKLSSGSTISTRTKLAVGLQISLHLFCNFNNY